MLLHSLIGMSALQCKSTLYDCKPAHRQPNLDRPLASVLFRHPKPFQGASDRPAYTQIRPRWSRDSNPPTIKATASTSYVSSQHARSVQGTSRKQNEDRYVVKVSCTYHLSTFSLLQAALTQITLTTVFTAPCRIKEMISSMLVSLMAMVRHAIMSYISIHYLLVCCSRFQGSSLNDILNWTCLFQGGFATSDWLEQNLETFIEASWQNGNAAPMAITDAFVEVICSLLKLCSAILHCTGPCFEFRKASCNRHMYFSCKQLS